MLSSSPSYIEADKFYPTRERVRGYRGQLPGRGGYNVFLLNFLFKFICSASHLVLCYLAHRLKLNSSVKWLDSFCLASPLCTPEFPTLAAHSVCEIYRFFDSFLLAYAFVCICVHACIRHRNQQVFLVSFFILFRKDSGSRRRWKLTLTQSRLISTKSSA